MSPRIRRTDPDDPASAAGLSRRHLLGAAGAAGAATMVFGAAAPTARATTATTAAGTPAQQRAMILQVARAGTVFPIALPAYNEAGPVSARPAIGRLRRAERRAPAGAVKLGSSYPPTMGRLRAAEQGFAAGPLAAAHAGAGSLIAAGLLGAALGRLVEGVGEMAARTTGGDPSLAAAVTLAVATVFPGSGDQAGSMAQQWLSLLRIMSQRATLHTALHERGLA